jgi:hypothetical protein
MLALPDMSVVVTVTVVAVVGADLEGLRAGAAGQDRRCR